MLPGLFFMVISTKVSVRVLLFEREQDIYELCRSVRVYEHFKLVSLPLGSSNIFNVNHSFVLLQVHNLCVVIPYNDLCVCVLH